jgi:hypothetical protein
MAADPVLNPGPAAMMAIDLVDGQVVQSRLFVIHGVLLFEFAMHVMAFIWRRIQSISLRASRLSGGLGLC